MIDITYFKEYAENEGVTPEAYRHLFMNHEHDESCALFEGGPIVSMSIALEAVRKEREAIIRQQNAINANQ